MTGTPSVDEEVQAWSRDAWVDSAVGHAMTEIQGRIFLHNTVRAQPGQRVEIILRNPSPDDVHSAIQCRLSGQVVRISSSDRPLTSLCRPPAHAHDHSAGTCDTLAMILALGKRFDLFQVFPEGSTLAPCPDPDCTGGNCAGRLYMPQSVWEERVDEETKERIKDLLVVNLGAIPGQEVICEGRLHFDYDMRRGSEEPPPEGFGDGIPFDGRDVWQFTLTLDDWRENFWQVVPGSLINLGRNTRPRCWPWSMARHLPYDRSGEEDFDLYYGPGGRAVWHYCIGPFGCPGTTVGHEHDFPSATAA